MKAARIILDQPLKIERGWCWRDDWATGFDSAYGLFSKFAKLNAMGARELANLFIDRDCGQRTAILRAPKVDLRSSELFDVEEVARHLRLETAHVRNAFLLDQLVNSRRKSSDVLRWCPRCAASGFHSPVFQLNLLGVCPAHGQAIRSRCPKCKAEIPYRLQANVFEAPFCCSSCFTDLAPALRNPKTRSLLLREAETKWIPNLVELFAFEDKMVPLKLELNRKRKLLGMGEVAIATADWHRVTAEYTGFVKQVIDDLESERIGSQRGLHFNQVAVTIKHPSSRAVFRNAERRHRARRSKTPTDIPTSSILKRGWDDRLRASYLVYDAVRRHLWRHVLHDHQDCIAAAGKHLWWHMEGERTASFCPVAEAFLRWRMYWESCGTPCYLFKPMRKDPFGLAGWMAANAPICPPDWSWESEQWVSDHVLGQACISSFGDCLNIAIQDCRRGRIEWNGHAIGGSHSAYWAVAGRDIPGCPVRLYEQTNVREVLENVVRQYSGIKSHRHDHRAALTRIER
jgi:hypothetical protein